MECGNWPHRQQRQAISQEHANRLFSAVRKLGLEVVGAKGL